MGLKDYKALATTVPIFVRYQPKAKKQKLKDTKLKVLTLWHPKQKAQQNDLEITGNQHAL